VDFSGTDPDSGGVQRKCITPDCFGLQTPAGEKCRLFLFFVLIQTLIEA
jgi:hypothetical protein